MSVPTSPNQLILVPGLLEPCFAFLPLKRSLSNHCPRIDCWRDRLIFRDIEASVNRLAAMISRDANDRCAIGIITHSFGDWIARAAITRSRQHQVKMMISLAPVMRSGFLPTLLYGFSGNLIPEVKVIMNGNDAMANLDCDDRVRRLVIWSRFDESLRSVPLDHIRNLQVQRVWATHFSIPWQPNVLRAIDCFLSSRSNAPK